MRLAGAVQSYVIVLRFGVIELVHWNDMDPSAIFNDDARRILPGRLRRILQLARIWCSWRFAQASAYALQRRLEALDIEGLKQIVDRCSIKSFHRVLVVSGHKHHGHFAADQLQNLEPIELWHLDVEEQ